jgi:hypothetical protein
MQDLQQKIRKLSKFYHNLIANGGLNKEID